MQDKKAFTREQIEQRAYEIYLQRGGRDGSDTGRAIERQRQECTRYALLSHEM